MLLACEIMSGYMIGQRILLTFFGNLVVTLKLYGLHYLCYKEHIRKWTLVKCALIYGPWSNHFWDESTDIVVVDDDKYNDIHNFQCNPLFHSSVLETAPNILVIMTIFKPNILFYLSYLNLAAVEDFFQSKVKKKFCNKCLWFAYQSKYKSISRPLGRIVRYYSLEIGPKQCFFKSNSSYLDSCIILDQRTSVSVCLCRRCVHDWICCKCGSVASSSKTDGCRPADHKDLTDTASQHRVHWVRAFLSFPCTFQSQHILTITLWFAV